MEQKVQHHFLTNTGKCGMNKMGILTGLQPEKVFYFFEQLCAIPHGSGNTKQISDFCVDFAKQRGLEYYQDEFNNVVIFKPASVGCEKAEPVILQGHLDMVCKKEDSSDFDFTKDGLDLIIDGDWLTANGTTLGGDDGAAVAMAMAVLDSDELVHPPIEAVFTTDEETGMEGAAGLDTSILRGRRMINIDSEDEGILTVSCAGGCRANCTLPITRDECCSGTALYRVTISGLLGGHSGIEIDRGRASSNQLMGRLLDAASKRISLRIADIFGGTLDNVIPSLTWADIAIAPEDETALSAVVNECLVAFRKEYATADPNIIITIERINDSKAVASAVDTAKIISALVILPYGVQAMSADIAGLVQTSLNLGILHMTDTACELSFSIRSSIASQKSMLIDRVEKVITLLGGNVTLYGDYPAWEYRHDSPLRDVMVSTWTQLYGSEPKIEAIHAGLECGLFGGKIDGLDAVSCGPDMRDVHSPQERLSISSTARMWDYICAVLKKLADM